MNNMGWKQQQQTAKDQENWRHSVDYLERGKANDFLFLLKD